MPPAQFRHQATTSADPHHVWERLQDPTTWGTVAGIDGTREHTFDGPRLTGFRFTTTVAGVPYRGTARVTHSTPGRSMTLSIRSSELHGSITVTLDESNPGTILDVEMTMRPVGLLGPMVFPLINRAVDEGFPDSVERLALKLADQH